MAQIVEPYEIAQLLVKTKKSRALGSRDIEIFDIKIKLVYLFITVFLSTMGRIVIRGPSTLYSRDLAPSDFHLFPNLKTFVAGKAFGSNEEVEKAVNDYFYSLSKSLPTTNKLMSEKR